MVSTESAITESFLTIFSKTNSMQWFQEKYTKLMKSTLVYPPGYCIHSFTFIQKEKLIEKITKQKRFLIFTELIFDKVGKENEYKFYKPSLRIRHLQFSIIRSCSHKTLIVQKKKENVQFQQWKIRENFLRDLICQRTKARYFQTVVQYLVSNIE